MFKVGLTGGIGTGKSYIGKLFSVYGVRIIDSDVIARVVVLPGSPTLKAIAAHFGPQVIAADGTLNRRALREIVFSDQAHLAELNGLIHPAIHELINQYTALAEQNHVWQGQERRQDSPVCRRTPCVNIIAPDYSSYRYSSPQCVPSKCRPRQRPLHLLSRG